MNKLQIEKIQSLDPEGLSGTIQYVLLRDDLNVVQFSDAIWWLLNRTLEEKQAVMKENEKMRKILEANGLYTSELLFEEQAQ